MITSIVKIRSCFIDIKKYILKTKIYKHFYNHWDNWVKIVVLLMILLGYLFPDKRNPSDKNILIPSNSIYNSVIEKNTRSQIQLNSIQLHKGFIVQQDIASESIKMQGRLLFITLFSALITILFSSRYKEYYRYISFTALVVGFFWYGMNINKLNIENRGKEHADMISNTELKLLNIPPEDNRMYFLDVANWRNATIDDKQDHKIEKIERFFRPDFADTVFNIMPLLILTLLYGRLKKSYNSVAIQVDQQG